MKSVTRTAALLLLLALGTEATGVASVSSRKAAYVGGTVTAFAGATEPIGGSLDTSAESALAFTSTDAAFAGRTVTIPYRNILDVEYGQKAGRRVGAAIGYSLLVGPVGLLALLSKKRTHYVTVGYTGPRGEAEVAVLEIGKDIVRSTLAIVQARSGKKVVYQDRDARRAVGQGASTASQTWIGDISSSNCGATHTAGMTARECTQQCIDSGHAWVFVSNGTVYELANQQDKQLRVHAGETVVLTGELKGNVITASNIVTKEKQ